MQQRRDEILVKKAKLEELKRQRTLRAREASNTRSIGSATDVGSPLALCQGMRTIEVRTLTATACISYTRETGSQRH